MNTCCVTALFACIVLTVEAESYYVDYENGSDDNNGLSMYTPWKHSPGDASATGIPAGISLAPGDIVYFKRGVSYKSVISCNWAGSNPESGFNGTVTSEGIFKSAGKNFQETVVPGDYLYIYNYGVDNLGEPTLSGTYLGAVGLWKIEEIIDNITLKLKNYNGREHLIDEMAYNIYRPVSYTSIEDWGEGEAIFDAENIRTNMFHTRGNNYLRWANLKFINQYWDCDRTLHLNCINGATDGDQTGHIVENNHFEDIYCAYRVRNSLYSVIRGNKVINYEGHALFSGQRTLVEYNYINHGTQGILSVGTQSVSRYNIILNSIKGSCGNHGNAFAPIGYGRKYGWIYGNFLSNIITGIPLTWTAGGTRGFVLHSNVIIGYHGMDETPCGMKATGARAIQVYNAPDTKIYNNTIIGFGIGWSESTSIRQGSAGSEPSPGCELKNNIFYNLTPNGAAILLDSLSLEGFVASNNLYYYPNRNPWRFEGVTLSYEAWQELTGDSESIFDDPQFINLADGLVELMDLRLNENSPAINTGAFLNEVYADINGVFRPQGESIDRGAYEFVSLTGIEGYDNLPESFELNQNYPNPFNPITTINYSLLEGGLTILKIYDVMGREVITLMNEIKPPGSYSVQWDGTNSAGAQVGSGVYFYQLITEGGYTGIKKMVLIR